MAGTSRPALGRDIFFRYLVDQGVEYIFGNPGTTELPIVDGCNDYPGIEYVLSLHEDIAVAQAMGYARASGRPGIVNLHVTPGVAHGLGNIYNAFRARVPLLVTAGQHHTGLLVQDPILTADLVGLTAPFTKWSYEVRFLDELRMVLPRAFKELTTPPYGPVFLSMPPNVLLERDDASHGDVVRVARVMPQIAPPEAFTAAADLLVSARNPMVIAGDGVGLADAWGPVARIAERIGARVYTEGYSTAWNFPADHDLYLGPMPNLATEMRARFDDTDVVILCGVASQAPVSRYDGGGPLVPFSVQSITVDDSPWEMGKNHPSTIGLLGDVGRNLQLLADAIGPIEGNAELSSRIDRVRKASARRRATWDSNVAQARDSGELTPLLVAAVLRDQLDESAIVVDESISNRASFVNVLDFADPLSYYAANGLSLGFSGGAAVGLKMAAPGRAVVNVVGDGSFLYYPHALWNAANLGAPLLFIVLNNGSYRVLKLIVERMGGPWGSTSNDPPGLEIGSPSVDFVGLARSLGVPGERVTASAELVGAVERGLGAGGPYLLDIAVAQPVGGTAQSNLR